MKIKLGLFEKRGGKKKKRRKFTKIARLDRGLRGTKLPRVWPNRQITFTVSRYRSTFPFDFHSISIRWWPTLLRLNTGNRILCARVQQNRQNIGRAGERCSHRRKFTRSESSKWVWRARGAPQACETDALSVICDRYARGRIVINITGK